MSNDNNRSDVQKSAENVNPNAVEDNLEDKLTDTEVEQPENISEKEETPFIDDELRTDK